MTAPSPSPTAQSDAPELTRGGSLSTSGAGAAGWLNLTIRLFSCLFQFRPRYKGGHAESTLLLVNRSTSDLASGRFFGLPPVGQDPWQNDPTSETVSAGSRLVLSPTTKRSVTASGSVGDVAPLLNTQTHNRKPTPSETVCHFVQRTASVVVMCLPARKDLVSVAMRKAGLPQCSSDSVEHMEQHHRLSS